MNSVGLCIGNFQSQSDFREFLCTVFLKNLCGAGSPSNAGKPLRSSFLYFHLLFIALLFISPLTPSFSLSLPVNPSVAFEVLLYSAAWLCGHGFVSFYLSFLSFHSGVTHFFSPTEGITSLKGTVVVFVHSCTCSTV